MTHIFLIGYMCCGKTTLGMALARELGMPFIDLDNYIEERCESTIRTLYQEVGEKRFREIERQALHEVSHTAEAAVVACGGGTPCTPGNMELMNRVGITVWLRTSVNRITSRLVLPEQRSKRPLLNNMSDEEIKESVKKGFKARNKFYKKAQLQFDSTYLESEQEINGTAQRLAYIITNL